MMSKSVLRRRTRPFSVIHWERRKHDTALITLTPLRARVLSMIDVIMWLKLFVLEITVWKNEIDLDERRDALLRGTGRQLQESFTRYKKKA